MGHLSVARALSVRLLFAAHGIVSIWRLADVTNDVTYWYLASSLVLLFLESMVTLVKRQGKEWKWFCPSVFIYLLTSVPAIWLLELHEFDKRAKRYIVRVARMYNQTTACTDTPTDKQEDLSSPMGSFLGMKFEIRIPISLTPDQWIRMLEQILLLILILGRWLLPKGKLTHDQLSQLLLVYIGTAADIVEFFEAFKEKEVQYNKILCFVILGIWSLSLLQFSLVLTAARARRDKTRLYLAPSRNVQNKAFWHADVFGILITILLQDLPFLVLRLLLIFHYNVLSYTNMFFTSKNTLVIALLVYRLVVLFIERRYPDDKISVDSTHEAPIPDSGIFRRTSEIRRSILKCYDLDTGEGADTVSFRNQWSGTNPRDSREFAAKQEHHKYGRSYHFELIQDNTC